MVDNGHKFSMKYVTHFIQLTHFTPFYPTSVICCALFYHCIVYIYFKLLNMNFVFCNTLESNFKGQSVKYFWSFPQNSLWFFFVLTELTSCANERTWLNSGRVAMTVLSNIAVYITMWQVKPLSFSFSLFYLRWC